MYDRLFLEIQPYACGKDFIEALNLNSLKVVTTFVDPSLASARADQKYQFVQHGYFVVARVNHAAGKPVLNLATGLREWVGKVTWNR
jgi:glutaminyl-tRNA synthetase